MGGHNVSCQPRIMYYLYLLIVSNVTKEKYHYMNYIQYNIEDTAAAIARMFNIQMMELTVFADQSIEFLILGAAASSSVLSQQPRRGDGSYQIIIVT